MAYTAGELFLRASSPGNSRYEYNATTTGASDTLAELLVAGYFNNTDDDLNLAVGDTIWCRCTDGNMHVAVSAVAAGSVTCQFAGGNLPTTQSQGCGTGACDARLLVGAYELTSATGDGTSTHWMLPTPYPGAEVSVRLDCSMTTARHFDCGGATNVVLDGRGNRRIRMNVEGDSFHVVGVSTTRWRIHSMTVQPDSFLTGASGDILTSTHV
jgi:hypothetical protein